MATGVKLPGSEKLGGVRLEIPATDMNSSNPSVSPSPSPSRMRMPKRLRERLLECKNTSPTVGEIEAKLRDADLRRQVFLSRSFFFFHFDLVVLVGIFSWQFCYCEKSHET